MPTRLSIGNITMRAQPSIARDGEVTFEVTDPNSGATYNLTGIVTSMDIVIERPEYSRFPTGPASTTMTFTVEATAPLRRYHGPAVAWVDMRRGPSADLYIEDECIHEPQAVTNAPQAPPRQLHAFEVNPDEPGICARESCGMWPDHHNHGYAKPCVCSVCMPDADDLPNDQGMVSISSETTMRPGPITGQSHP